MSVIVYTDHPDNPVLVFAEADDYTVDLDSHLLHVVKPGSSPARPKTIATFRKWASVAVLSNTDAKSSLAWLATLFPCEKCADREARLKDSLERLSRAQASNVPPSAVSDD
jgi:hypothetical protein